MDISKIWLETQRLIKEKIGTSAFDAWFSLLKIRLVEPQIIGIEVPDEFFRDRLIKNYLPIIQESFKSVNDKISNITFVINPDLINKEDRPRINAFESHIIKEPIIESPRLNSRYTFDDFVVGSCNRFAHAASLAVAESPAKAYNPLFIYGGVGLGKTHLMQAICHFIRAKNKDIKITYIPSERFTNELIDAIQHRTTNKFRQRYRNADILVLDDIHFIAGKESTQEEFFHTFNTLYDNHKQIIISSDRNPKEISNLEERLVSRFSWGLICDIQPPDFETRVAILRKKIQKEPVNVPEDVIYFIAKEIKSNIRELEGTLIRVVAYSLLSEKPISLELAKDILKDLLKETKKTITPDLIQREVANFFNISIADLKTRKRNKNLIMPRQTAMYLVREMTDLSFPEIGQFFGGKDHTTILHAYNKIKGSLKTNPDLSTKIKTITDTINQY